MATPNGRLPPPTNTAAAGPNAGTQTFTTPNNAWRILTRKQPILKADPIEALSARIGIPIPEMIFGDNFVAIEHVPSGWKLSFNAEDALDRVSKTEEGMLQVAVADAWKKDREGMGAGAERVVRPFDWSYSTDYKGTTTTTSPDGKAAGEGGWQLTDQSRDPIRTDLLSRPDPILFFDSVDLYEDELADNGIGLLSVKVRVMPERLLLLARFFLRLDGVVVRLRDTRVYVEHGGRKVVRQYTAREAGYEALRERLRGMRENVAEVLRDANALAPLLPVLEDRTEVFEVP